MERRNHRRITGTGRGEVTPAGPPADSEELVYTNTEQQLWRIASGPAHILWRLRRNPHTIVFVVIEHGRTDPGVTQCCSVAQRQKETPRRKLG